MSDLEEQLLGSDEEEEAPKPKRENSTIKQMREAFEAQKADLEAAREKATKLEATFLTQSGLTEKQASALKSAGYDASPEGIESFRTEVLGVEPTVVEEPTEQAVEEEASEEPFQPTKTGGKTPAGKREVDSEGLLELMQSDPLKADKLLREGRVAHKQFNPGGPAF